MNRILKRLFIGLCFCCGLLGCDIGGENWVKEDLRLNIEAWTLKDTSKLDTPFNLDLATSIDNTCIDNFEFVVGRVSKFQYFVWAQAVYDSRGGDCFYQKIIKDTTVSIAPDTVGKFFFYLKYYDAFIVDSIVVVP